MVMQRQRVLLLKPLQLNKLVLWLPKKQMLMLLAKCLLQVKMV